MKFELNQQVTIDVSGEQGTIIGRAEFVNSEPTYQLRYKNADSRAIESWWSESALS